MNSILDHPLSPTRVDYEPSTRREVLTQQLFDDSDNPYTVFIVYEVSDNYLTRVNFRVTDPTDHNPDIRYGCIFDDVLSVITSVERGINTSEL